jgi:hypothetical protein
MTDGCVLTAVRLCRQAANGYNMLPPYAPAKGLFFTEECCMCGVRLHPGFESYTYKNRPDGLQDIMCKKCHPIW